jgi:zinc and cadmium transporter
MADLRLGAVAALAVLVHEIPHHIGDLIVLRNAAGTHNSALIKVTMAGAFTALGGLVGFWLVEQLRDYIAYFLVLASSSFIYVALADLIPQLQKRLSARHTAAQVAWLLVGIGLVWGISVTAHVH